MIPLPLSSSYAAAKHALRGFVGTLRVELLERPSSVSVSTVHVGQHDAPGSLEPSGRGERAGGYHGRPSHVGLPARALSRPSYPEGVSPLWWWAQAAIVLFVLAGMIIAVIRL